MKLILITYTMEDTREVVKTTITLQMDNDIANEVLKYGIQSAYLGPSGPVRSILQLASQMQRHRFRNFCSAEDITNRTDTI